MTQDSIKLQNMSTNYHKVPNEEPDDDVTGRICISPDSTSSDIDIDDTEEADIATTSEKNLLLPTETSIERLHARRKAQLIKIAVISCVCSLDICAIPLFFGEVDSFWGPLPNNLHFAAKYTLFGTYLVSCMFSPMLIPLLGIKIIFMAGSIMVCGFVIAHFLPLQYSIVPICTFCGLTLGAFFSAQGVFISNCAFRYCKTLTTCDPDAIINILNGFFYTIFFIGPILMDGTKFVLLHQEQERNHDISLKIIDNSSGMSHCGASLCPGMRTESQELVEKPKSSKDTHTFHLIQAIQGFYLMFSIAGFIICAILFKSNHPFLVKLRNLQCCFPFGNKHSKLFQTVSKIDGVISLKEHCATSLQRWSHFFMSLVDVNILLVLPLFLYLGMQQAMFYIIFSKDIVECRLDHKYVYLIRILAASCSVIVSLPISLVARYVGRFRMNLPAASIQLSLVITMLLWQPGLDQWHVFFIMAALWGCADSSWQIMTSAMVGRLFRNNKEVAFSHLRLWQMSGIIILDLLRHLVCVNIIIYIFISILVCCLISSAAFEIRIRLHIQKHLPLSKQRQTAVSDVTVDLGQNISWMPTLDPHIPRHRASLAGQHDAKGGDDLWD